MKLELKNVKEYEELSEETCCFTADLYMDGKKVATAKNDGRGGCNDVYFIDGWRSDAAKAVIQYAKEHPYTYEFMGQKFVLDEVEDLIDRLLSERRFRTAVVANLRERFCGTSFRISSVKTGYRLSWTGGPTEKVVRKMIDYCCYVYDTDKSDYTSRIGTDLDSLYRDDIGMELRRKSLS